MVTEKLGLNFDLGKINPLLWLPFDRELQQQSGNENKKQNNPGWEHHIIILLKVQSRSFLRKTGWTKGLVLSSKR